MLHNFLKLIFLSTFIQLSFQICWNNICDTDKCTSNNGCPLCYECDTVCGYCNVKEGCCLSNNMCQGNDGECIATEQPDYTTCSYCDTTENLCKPGCIDNSNCPEGYQCNGHICVEKAECTDDAYCNAGHSGTCDVEHSPYTECFYCEDGECKPGCTSDSDCPSTHPTCDSDHICNARPGKVLLKSITFVTDSCTGCTTEGVETTLVGEKISGFPDGITCDTQKLDHEGTIDFANGASTTFDGKMNGAQNDQEEDMMGACFEFPLNNQLLGGFVKWVGDGDWVPKSVCVDWKDDSVFVNQCDVKNVGDNQFELVNCNDMGREQC